MKFIIIGILTANVLAASCIYDAASSEPSPVAGLVAVAQTIAAPAGAERFGCSRRNPRP